MQRNHAGTCKAAYPATTKKWMIIIFLATTIYRVRSTMRGRYAAQARASHLPGPTNVKPSLCKADPFENLSPMRPEHVLLWTRWVCAIEQYLSLAAHVQGPGARLRERQPERVPFTISACKLKPGPAIRNRQ